MVSRNLKNISCGFKKTVKNKKYPRRDAENYERAQFFDQRTNVFLIFNIFLKPHFGSRKTKKVEPKS